METKLKNSLFILLICLLLLPAIQHKFRWYNEYELNGHFEVPKKPSLNWESWITGEYQKKQDTYLNQVVGFRPGFVRLQHELDYDLYDLLHGNAVIKGESDFLFEESYINAALGKDYLGKDSIRYKTQLLRQLQDKLESKGVKLLFVFAPGKGYLYKNEIPEAYKNGQKKYSNYTSFIRAFKDENLNYIDFQAYTKVNLDISKYPLMCKTGIHWSQYMIYCAGDSIFSYINNKWGFDFPRPKLKAINTYDRAFGTDEDIELSLNLLRNLKDFPNMAYPHFTYSRIQQKSDPQLLVVGDSFYWGIFNNYKNQLNNPTFWYYFREQYPAKEQPIDPKSLNLKEELLKRKVIVLLFTDSNLKSFGYGFVEAAIKALS